MTGNALWSFFAECLNKTANTFHDNANIFGKVYFPRLTKPISTVISAGINFSVQMLIFMCLWGYFIFKSQVHPHWGAIAWLPFLLLVIGCMAMGCGIIVSSLTTKYRDLTIVVTFGVNLWMYATPVVYPLSLAKTKLMKTVLLCNPITQIMELFRYMLLGEGTVSLIGCVWSVSFSIMVVLLGILIFNRIEKTFMDTI